MCAIFSWVIDPSHRALLSLLLLYGVLTSGALSGAGIIWENRDETGEVFKSVAKKCIQVGVILELAFTLVLFISEESDNRALNRETASLRAENTEMQRILVPRRIPFGENINVFAYVTEHFPNLKTFKSIDVFIQNVPGAEPTKLALDIGNMLNFEGANVAAIDEKTSNWLPLYIPPGVRVVLPSSQPSIDRNDPFPQHQEIDDLKKPQASLIAFINAILGDGNATAGELSPPKMKVNAPGSTPYFEPQPHAVLIFVGDNPVAERLYLLKAKEGAAIAPGEVTKK
jgi:hypothetical protein